MARATVRAVEAADRPTPRSRLRGRGRTCPRTRPVPLPGELFPNPGGIRGTQDEPDGAIPATKPMAAYSGARSRCTARADPHVGANISSTDCGQCTEGVRSARTRTNGCPAEDVVPRPADAAHDLTRPRRARPDRKARSRRTTPVRRPHAAGRGGGTAAARRCRRPTSARRTWRTDEPGRIRGEHRKRLRNGHARLFEWSGHPHTATVPRNTMAHFRRTRPVRR